MFRGQSHGLSILSVLILAGALVSCQSGPEMEQPVYRYAPKWTVKQSQGVNQVRQSVESDWITITDEMLLEPGAEIRTEDEGEIVIASGGDLVSAMGSSNLILPRTSGSDIARRACP